MGNFTSEIKRELMRTSPEKRCCRLALLAAFLETGGFVGVGADGKEEISFTSENEDVAEYFLALSEELFGFSMTVTEAVRDPKYGRNKLTFSYSGENAADAGKELKTYSSLELNARDCCISECLKGYFLGSGSCTLPRGGAKTGYHLEIVFRSEIAAQNFCAILDRAQLFGNVVRRGEKFVVYMKSREGIADFLSVIGAPAALNRLEAVRAEREESNNNNRKGNCDAGNADKAAIASAVQVCAFGELESTGVLQTLPDPLRGAAYARMNNPTLCLQELADALGISKSCLNHRLRKLMKIHSEKENNQ